MPRKLTDADVTEIRARAAHGADSEAIAAEFGITGRHVRGGSGGCRFRASRAAIKSPQNRKTPSPWAQFDYGFRLDVLRGAYGAVSRYDCIDTAYPCALSGAVVGRRYSDRTQRAYEEVLHRFDETLQRMANETGEHQRGIVIHDESNIERNLQAWTQRSREVAGRIPGRLTHIVDVPFFADARATRMIQAADLVAFALWRCYGLPTSDSTWGRRTVGALRQGRGRSGTSQQAAPRQAA